MVRSYRMLAASGVVLLLAAGATGFAAGGDLHRPVSVTAVSGVVAIHAIVYGYFSTAVKQTREAARVHELPDWLPAQVERIRGRASRFILGGAVVLVVAAGLGFWGGPRWHLAASTFAGGFNAVAFAVEYVSVVSLQRLLAEMKARAARLPEAPAAPPHDPEPMSI